MPEDIPVGLSGKRKLRTKKEKVYKGCQLAHPRGFMQMKSGFSRSQRTH